MKELEEYKKQDIFNPKYLFHGSPYKLKKIEPRNADDSINDDNKDNAIFLTSWFINAVAYAFRNKLKELNNHYSFSINNNGKLPAMSLEVSKLPENLYGYVYVFKKSNDMIIDNHKNTTQYRCYQELVPISVIKVYYKDFKEYFDIKII